MLLRQVGLVSESKRVKPSQLTNVSAALQKQATHDLVQFWNVKATVDAFARLEDLPIGYWPIVIMDDIHESGAAGIHLDRNGQPFALVTASDRLDVWSLTCSHELIEMLVDPFGNRLVAGDSPKANQGRAQFLVEACDPSEDAQFAYTVNGVVVSDFYTIRFFDPVAAPSVRYSFTGAIQRPRQVLRGGYLSWLDVHSNTWWQETWFGGNKPKFRSLGQLSANNGSLRSQIDRLTARETTQALSGGVRAAKAAGVPLAELDEAASARAASLREQIQDLTQGGPAALGQEPEAAREDQEEAGAGNTWQQPARGRRAAAGQRHNGPEAAGLRMAPSVWEDWSGAAH
ncbi:MAG TPA: hypothetical protein VGC68_06985 [Enterovirga sp.]